MGKSSGRHAATSTRSARALRRRAGRVKPTPPEPPTLAPWLPVPRRQRGRAACPRGGGFGAAGMPRLLDQLDPPAVHDPVVGRCGDCHRPAEMMSYAQPHAAGPSGSWPAEPGFALRAEAGEGNRTLTKSLEGSCATTTPRPRDGSMIGARSASHRLSPFGRRVVVLEPGPGKASRGARLESPPALPPGAGGPTHSGVWPHGSLQRYLKGYMVARGRPVPDRGKAVQ